MLYSDNTEHTNKIGAWPGTLVWNDMFCYCSVSMIWKGMSFRVLYWFYNILCFYDLVHFCILKIADLCNVY